MDMTIDVEDYKLNVRASGVIIHNDKVLQQFKTFLKWKVQNTMR